MLIEQLIFIIIAFALFVYMFYQLIKKNDTKYVPILAIEAIRNRNRFCTIIFCRRRHKCSNQNNHIYIISNNTNISNNHRKNKWKHIRNNRQFYSKNLFSIWKHKICKKQIIKTCNSISRKLFRPQTFSANI